jgi:hypothetical protein
MGAVLLLRNSFQDAMRFQNANEALETCHFRKVSPFLCGQFLIWTCAPNSSRGSCLEVGDCLSFIYHFTACRLSQVTLSWMTRRRLGYQLTLSLMLIPCLLIVSEYIAFSIVD